MMRRCFGLLMFTAVLWGQEATLLRGRTIDSQTGEPLMGVNIMVKGTYSGASSGLDGSFLIRGLSPGSYDLEVTYMGYKIIQRNGVTLEAGEEAVENFGMQTTVLSFGRDVVVIGKRPLFDVSETASSIKMSNADISAMIVDDLGGILEKAAGVSATDNEVHIRGGRLDETLFIIDGIATKDPLTGYGANLYVNADAIEELEILTGGYSAEYGQAMSGVVNVKLKKGSDRYEGSFKFSTDEVGSLQSYGSNRLEFNLGGPSIWERGLERLGLNVPGKFYFFLVGYGKVADTHLPSATRLYPHVNLASPAGSLGADGLQQFMDALAPREENDWHGMYKLTWQLTPRINLTGTYDLSANINQGFYMPRAFSNVYFPYRYMEILDNYNTVTRTTQLVSTVLSHTISPRSFYELKLGRFITREHSAVQDLDYTEYRQRLDLDPTDYVAASADGEIRITYGDRFYDTGMSSEWYDTFSDNLVLKGDWTYHFSERQRMKAGFEGNRITMQVLDIDEPWAGATGLGVNYDIYRANTSNGSFYFQDNLTFEGMIVNVGARYDYWIPGAYLEAAVNDSNSATITDAARAKFQEETFGLFGRRVKGHISPRLGISHPVTDNDVLYFYYGHFSQQPTYQYVFARLNSRARGTYQIIGNPTLNPKTTVQYEIGLKHRFSEDQILELKAYWKNMYNYETSETITSDNPRYAHLSFNMYFNADYARSRGVEAIVRMRFLRYFQADGMVGYSIITGKSSTPNDNLLVQAGALREKPLGESFLAWDRPVQAFANLSFHVPRDNPRRVLGLRNWGGSLRVDYETGRRYTSQTLIDDDDEGLGKIRGVDGKIYYNGTSNSDNPFNLVAVKPRFYLDTRLYKNWQLNKVRLRLFVEVENLLNERVPRRINAFTGRGYGPEPDKLYSYSLINQPNPNLDPSRIERPRRVEFGLQVSF